MKFLGVSKKKRLILSSSLIFLLIVLVGFAASLVYANAALSAVDTTDILLSASPEAGAGMLADNTFIFAAPVALIFVIYQAFVLSQIKENTSTRKAGQLK
ncbi:MAG: hypothetical protein ABIH66_10985 [bacterium]